MTDKIAIKRLTASDCTLFESVYRTIGTGNQKSINLNADVFVDLLFPNISSSNELASNVIALALNLFGPGERGPYAIARKIIKKATYKNWRLNGEFIHGPPEDPSRYESVRPGDFAVMIFKGEAVPSALDLILVSQAEPADIGLHTSLGSLFIGKSMVVATAAQIAEAVAASAVSPTHPIHIAAADPELDAMLEDAAQSGFDGARNLLKRRSGRKTTASDLAAAKAKADLVGRLGEGLVDAYLTAKQVAGQIASYKWESAENAIAPYDFEVNSVDGERILIDAKSTGGAFENVIHISLAEIVEAADGAPYYIYRVYDLNPDRGRLCISENIRPLAQKLKALHEENMPVGVRVDGFSVATSTLVWGASENLVRPEEESDA